MKKLTRFAPVFAVVMLGVFSPAVRAQEGYTAHEWGTFTSVQGGNGELLSWRPLKTSELPGFVYDWKQPGMNRRFAGFFAGSEPYLGKGFMITLQRMETPVIYFYSDREMNVDVSVSFPKGLITEWYPQATQMGPSLPSRTNELDGFWTKESRAVWKNLFIMPGNQNPQNRGPLIRDGGGSHYYAARDTDSDTVQTTASGQTNATEFEKFLFYRGVGNFATPLRVRVTANDVVSVENAGARELGHLFLISVHDGYGAFESMETLAPHAPTQWAALAAGAGGGLALKRRPLGEFQRQIAVQMESALTNTGLFSREARAMVNTWRDSWFTEEGERVLYLLPRAWTDATLPINFAPQPEGLVRVMVGRAEIITPKSQRELAEALTGAAAGDAAARKLAIRKLETLGRFAEPALQLANVHTNSSGLEIYGFGLLPEVASAGSAAR
jgi:hypothetical protein